MALSSLANVLNSLRAQSGLAKSTSALERVSERLSSGQRIVHASDDAAGLAVSVGLQEKARIARVAGRNIDDGISILNTADSALSSLKNIALRQQELATEAANGTYTLSQRRALDQEANALTTEFNRIVSTTTFNGQKLFDDASTTLQLQIGFDAAGSVSLSPGSALHRTVSDGTYTANDTGVPDGIIRNIAVGDFNGDGIADVVQQDYNIGSISDGLVVTSSNGVTQTLIDPGGSPGTPHGVVVGDFDGDGKLDILASTSYRGTSFFKGNGDGTFANVSGGKYAYGTVTSNLPVVVNGAFVTDVNKDGKSDLIIGNGSTITTYIATSNGNFTTGASTSLGAYTDIQFGDFNSDGTLDVIAGNDGTGSVKFFSGGGSGAFSLSGTTNVGAGNELMTTGDFNHDGLSDIVTQSGGGQLTVWNATSGGTFTAGPSFNSGGANILTVGDLNGDGAADLVIGQLSIYAYAGLFTANVAFGNGNGTFGAMTSIGSLTWNSVDYNAQVFATDLNRDGVLDILTEGGTFTSGTQTKSTIATVSLLSQTDARSAMSTISSTLQRIASEQSNVGAWMSRLTIARTVADVTNENFLAASSRITDIDVASETADFVRLQILQQTQTALLAQANQEPSLVARLLG